MNKRGFISALSLGSGTLFSLPAIAGIAGSDRKSCQPDYRSRGPISEVARLISRVHGERARMPTVTSARRPPRLAMDNEPPRLPPAPQLPADLNGPEQAFELDERLYDDEAYDVDDQPCAADEECQNEVPRVRRGSLTLVMAIIGLALVGTAGAFGYHNIFGGSVLPNPSPNINVSNVPNTIAPASSQLQAKSSGNESQVGAETTGSIENMSRMKSSRSRIRLPPPSHLAMQLARWQ